ncbi:MAG TPA: hypothetical protein VKN36_10265 [Eudoraea sp.]|nr:hypothetical protein [Eudoraea sp.]
MADSGDLWYIVASGFAGNNSRVTGLGYDGLVLQTAWKENKEFHNESYLGEDVLIFIPATAVFLPY